MKTDDSSSSLRGRYTTRAGLAALMLVLLQGCATGPNANPKDPLEPFNRGVTKFNDAVDKAVIKPVAEGYVYVTPDIVRKGVGNFFNNLSDAWSFVNNVLQLKGEAAGDSLARVITNTMLGLGGLIDFATPLNIERHREDFGQTLGYWGVPSGPYLVLPILGPSTLRDTAALPADIGYGSAVSYINNDAVRYGLTGLRLIDTRASLLRAGNLLEEAALDKYSFQRDVFLQARRSLVFDGNEPPEEDQTAPPAAAPSTKP
ncbi:MAG: ABC transporter [Betaproteobacteria bacterium HGW-Betaproteobacteria-3]|nr:MAG: ABC transporter [Betaproteobacteria bacterium HGW-Betaproteobacteria-3]